MVSPKSTVSPPILSGWKEIANHLGKGVRTVQRYEIEVGLPIRRPAGKSRGSVVATTAELDAWVSASPLKRSFSLRPALSDNRGTLDSFKKVLEEHHRLREEMTRFRGEMHTAMQELRENLGSIRARDIDESRRGSGILAPVENEKRRLN